MDTSIVVTHTKDKETIERKRKVRFIEVSEPRPKTQTELKRRDRSLSFSDTFIVVEWLNATIGTASHQRVLGARQELEELQAMLDHMRHQMQAAKKRRALTEQEMLDDCKNAVERADLHTEFRERHNAFNQLLSRYTFAPALAYNLRTGIWRFATIPKTRQGREIKIPQESSDVRVNEASVIAALARLATNRELYKVRLCAQCRKRWRVSEREIDRFCSQRCRGDFYKAQPDFLDRKAKNQKKWRDQQKLDEAQELVEARRPLLKRKGTK